MRSTREVTARNARRTRVRPVGPDRRELPVIGFDIGGTKIASGLVDRQGHVRRAHQHPTNAPQPARRTIAQLTECLKTCWGAPPPPIAAVGVGVAGQVDPNGTVLFAPNLRWHHVRLASELSKVVDCPVMVTNDVRAITYGVWKHGAGRGVQDLVCVFIGTGVGGGIVSEGRLRSGPNGTAGELGHMTLVAGGRSCHCPNRGCWEAYVGGWAIAERAREAVTADAHRGARLVARAGGIVDRITAETVDEAYLEGDPLARQIVRETVRYLIDGLVSVVNAIDPKVVVLGGGVMGGLTSFLDEINEGVRSRSLPAAARGLRIVPAELGRYSGVVGAATFALEALQDR